MQGVLGGIQRRFGGASEEFKRSFKAISVLKWAFSEEFQEDL